MASQIAPRPMPPKPQKSPKRPRKRLNSESVKRREEKKLYKIASAEYLAEHPICEWENTLYDLDGTAFPSPCIHKSTQIHHKAGRAGKLLYDKRYFMAVCNHHGGLYPHEHAEESYAKGFMILRHNVTGRK